MVTSEESASSTKEYFRKKLDHDVIFSYRDIILERSPLLSKESALLCKKGGASPMNSFVINSVKGDINVGQVSWEAPSNIALVKYWGKKGLQLPMNSSLSLSLSSSKTKTTLSGEKSLKEKGFL